MDILCIKPWVRYFVAHMGSAADPYPRDIALSVLNDVNATRGRETV